MSAFSIHILVSKSLSWSWNTKQQQQQQQTKWLLQEMADVSVDQVYDVSLQFTVVPKSREVMEGRQE